MEDTAARDNEEDLLDLEDFGDVDLPEEPRQPILSTANAKTRRQISPPRFDDEDEEDAAEKEGMRQTGFPPRFESRETREERRRRANPWGGEQKKGVDELTPVSRAATTELYRELRIGEEDSPSYMLDAIIVKGCDDMQTYDVEKIFAAYRPRRVEMADKTSSVVCFLNRSDAAAMMIHQTKRLRRVRSKRAAPEEGEVRDDSGEEEEEEEGQVMEEQGDDVAVEHTRGAEKPKRVKEDVVEINTDDISLPEGKWRVVTKHVPERRLILVRFATEEEVQAAREYHASVVGSSTAAAGRRKRAYESEDGFKYSWNEDKTRPGLNVFDDKGNELEWDYEHDTRFYDDLDSTREEEKDDAAAQESWPVAAKKVRGRGAKSAKFGLTESTLRADDAKKEKKKDEIPRHRKLASRVTGGVFAESDDDEQAPTDEPTPQPWDRPVPSKRLRDRITFHR